MRIGTAVKASFGRMPGLDSQVAACLQANTAASCKHALTCAGPPLAVCPLDRRPEMGHKPVALVGFREWIFSQDSGGRLVSK